MKLQKDLKEFIELLNSRGVKYLVVGAYSLAYHGIPRFITAEAFECFTY